MYHKTRRLAQAGADVVKIHRKLHFLFIVCKHIEFNVFLYCRFIWALFLQRLFYADTLIIISVDFYILTFTIHGINIAEIVSQYIDNVKESKACFRLVGTIVFRNHVCFTAFVVTFIYHIN